MAHRSRGEFEQIAIYMSEDMGGKFRTGSRDFDAISCVKALELDDIP